MRPVEAEHVSLPMYPGTMCIMLVVRHVQAEQAARIRELEAQGQIAHFREKWRAEFDKRRKLHNQVRMAANVGRVVYGLWSFVYYHTWSVRKQMWDAWSTVCGLCLLSYMVCAHECCCPYCKRRKLHNQVRAVSYVECTVW